MHHLRFIAGDLEGQELELPEARITFGRAEDNVIATNNPAVSSHHAVLVPESGGFVVYDLNSSNGTFVNGQQIQQKRLLNGDRIRIGIMEMVYELEGAAPVVETPAPTAAPPEPEIKPVSKPVEVEPVKVVVEAPPAPMVKPEPIPEKVEPKKVEPEKVIAPPSPAPAPPPVQPAPKPVAPVVVPPRVEPVAPPSAPPPPPAPVKAPIIEKAPVQPLFSSPPAPVKAPVVEVLPVQAAPPPPPPVKPVPVVEKPAPVVLPVAPPPPAPVQVPAVEKPMIPPVTPVVPPPAPQAPMRVVMPPKEEKPAESTTPPKPFVPQVEPPRQVPAVIANFRPLFATPPTPPPPAPEKKPLFETPVAPAVPVMSAVVLPVKAPLPPIEPAAPVPVVPEVPVKVVVTEIVREYPRDVRKQFEILPPVNASVFVQDAKQLVALRESSGQFVPFKSCWPAYDAMDAAQQRWYFYWRDVLRHEQYPTTDTAYIFLHAYELLNQVGVRNAADGFRQLHTLWLRYRGRHPRMDAYFVDWIADYVIVNPCGVDPLSIYFEAFELGGYAGDPDLLLNRVLATKDAPLPRRLLLALADYPLRYSKFYLDGNQKLLDEFVLKAFQMVDARLAETEGLGILEKFTPETAETVRRIPFQGALCVGNTEEIPVATVLPFSKSRRLRDFANAVVKHTENCFREAAGYPGRLQSYELSPDLRTAISAYIRINAASLVKSPKGGTFVRTENRFSNESAVRSILIRCSEEEKEGVRMASEQGGASLPMETIEHVNHLARRFLGDTLLFCKNASWHIADDFQEDVKVVLAQRARTDPALWQKFLSHLSDTQRRILAAICTQKIFSDEIRQLSGSRGALETVFHSINDMARKTVGEDLIDTLAIPPHIDREDAESIQELLTM